MGTVHLLGRQAPYGARSLLRHLPRRCRPQYRPSLFESPGRARGFTDFNYGKIEQNSENTYTIITETNVKISFFGGIHLGRVGTPLTMPGTAIQIASLDDLLAMKLATIFNRIEFKDYFDISAMLQNGMDLSRGLSSAKAMYGNQFQPIIILKTLTYFEGGDLYLLSKKDKNVLLNAASKVTTLPKAHILSYTLYDERAQEETVAPYGCSPCQ